MARQAEDISKIEDIGERLDALLDALETSSSEVARVGSALDTPITELLAEEPAAKPHPEPASATPGPEPKPEQPEPESEAEAAPEQAEPEPVEASEFQPVAEEAALDEPEDAAAEEASPAIDTPSEPEAVIEEDATELDDGLLIEPESYQKKPVDDIDGAPVGPLNLEEELDNELESLLASGVFEDPLAEMGVDESAEPLELPEEPLKADEAPEPVAEERTPNLPTDEAELIGELDEQLAALAEAQLAEPDLVEPVESSKPEEAPAAEPAPVVAAAPEAKAEPAPEPEIVTKPIELAPTPKQGWQLHAERALRVAKPVAAKAMVRTGKLAVAGATRASAPFNDKPQVKQIIGWVGLVQAFLAGCVWAYLVLWHNPPAPPPQTPQPTIVAPSEG